MEYIKYAIGFTLVVFMFIAFIKIFMLVANYVGEQFGFGKFIMYLWEKITSKNNEQK